MGAAPSSPSSSSCSSAFPPKKYDVFISFRGEDTRANFVSHLHTALLKKNIKTFIDYELRKGDEISQALLEAIQDSSISVVVFSKDYASSRWCLDELTEILQCKSTEAQVVLPIFYQIDPSHVRKQKGAYEEAIAKHMRDFKHNQDKVRRWKEALTKTANLGGWNTRGRDESKVIQEIVNDISQKLHHKCEGELKGFVGIDENCECIELLLKENLVVGIWGIGGIGKTTMAKVVFSKLSSQFESCCFLENFREESKKGPNSIREKIISKLLEDENIYGSLSISSKFVMRRLSEKKVFIVLDDVSDLQQLDDLATEFRWLGQGSRVIITTRDKHTLDGIVKNKAIHEAKALGRNESLKLFCLKAFCKDDLIDGYEKLSERTVAYAKGIPLALIVLGLFLRHKTIEEWDSALTNLEKVSNRKIQDVLQLSYDGLTYEEKEIFLDIACFFKGEKEEDVKRLYDTCNFSSSIILRTLSDKALITIVPSYLDNTYCCIEMHDLIQGMGREIVRQQCIEDPGRRNRLYDNEDVLYVLKYNKVSDAIRGLLLDLSQIKSELNLSSDTFKKMPNLRFLKFYFSSWFDRSSNVNLPFGLESFGDGLKYFHWDKYPLKSLPSNFCAEKLVEFHLIDSKIQKLWHGLQDLVNLKVVELTSCHQLMELPDFSKAQNLWYMNLFECRSLQYVHQSILSLPNIRHLNLARCINVRSLRSENPLNSLEAISLLGCEGLKEFSLESKKLSCLDLDMVRIEILGLSTGCMRDLTDLSINGSKLKNFPVNELCHLTSLGSLSLIEFRVAIERPQLRRLFDSLSSLYELYLTGCCRLSRLPDNISALSLLETLSLSEIGVESLPVSIKHLSKLQILYVRKCKKLRSLPQLPPFVSELYATDCTSLVTVSTFPFSYRMRKCLLWNCVNLDEHSICGITENSYFSFMRLLCVEDPVYYFGGYDNPVCYPGSRIPKWFGNNRTTNVPTTVELAPPFECLGFIFGVVLPHSPSPKDYDALCVKYNTATCENSGIVWSLRFRFGNDYSTCSQYFYLGPWKDSDHVFLWWEPISEIDLKHPKISFEFSSDENCLIREYGVCPMYASSKLIELLGNNVLEWRQRATHRDFEIDQVIRELILNTLGIGGCAYEKQERAIEPLCR